MENLIGGIILLVVVNFVVAVIGNIATNVIHKEKAEIFDFRGLLVGWLYVGGIWIVLYLLGVIK
jgi:hypothetical protein